MDLSANEFAFLCLISHAEGTDRCADSYRVVYGFALTLKDLSDHPFNTGEWKGGKITQGVYAGEFSTAAGRYQLTHTTWDALKRQLGLPDFGPASQDAAAIELIRQAKGLDFIAVGAIPEAITACSRIWASLPGNRAGQPQAQLGALLDAYSGKGGQVA